MYILCVCVCVFVWKMDFEKQDINYREKSIPMFAWCPAFGNLSCLYQA